MKKILHLFLAAVLLLGLFGCSSTVASPDTCPTKPETSGIPETTTPLETTAPESAPKENIVINELPGVTDPTQSTEGLEPPTMTEATVETEPSQPATKPTDPPAAQLPHTETPETELPATMPPSTEPSTPPMQPTQPEPTEPEPEPAEPPATEPEGCNHDWECVHHPEEGHWLAGIACDCGWEAYGDPDELLDAWYAHVNSYTPAEALLEHGGYGSMDQWIADKPAYDEWVCRHCGEPKP